MNTVNPYAQAAAIAGAVATLRRYMSKQPYMSVEEAFGKVNKLVVHNDEFREVRLWAYQGAMHLPEDQRGLATARRVAQRYLEDLYSAGLS